MAAQSFFGAHPKNSSSLSVKRSVDQPRQARPTAASGRGLQGSNACERSGESCRPLGMLQERRGGDGL